uniref:Uncharacterized protein n=1 Tax=Sphaerodactylus townsendi TaxID=933632 RepID=A0ACB8EYL8_9SAUR
MQPLVWRAERWFEMFLNPQGHLGTAGSTGESGEGCLLSQVGFLLPSWIYLLLFSPDKGKVHVGHSRLIHQSGTVMAPMSMGLGGGGELHSCHEGCPVEYYKALNSNWTISREGEIQLFFAFPG